MCLDLRANFNLRLRCSGATASQVGLTKWTKHKVTNEKSVTDQQHESFLRIAGEYKIYIEVNCS